MRFYSPGIALLAGGRSGSGSLSATTGFSAAALLEDALLSSGLRTVESSSSWVILVCPKPSEGRTRRPKRCSEGLHCAVSQLVLDDFPGASSGPRRTLLLFLEEQWESRPSVAGSLDRGRPRVLS